jgi:hypothetical protein
MSPDKLTIRAMLEELHVEVSRARGVSASVELSLFGPRPVDSGNEAKDPRSDTRSLIERIVNDVRELNGDLFRVSEGIGVTLNKHYVGQAATQDRGAQERY